MSKKRTSKPISKEDEALTNEVETQRNEETETVNEETEDEVEEDEDEDEDESSEPVMVELPPNSRLTENSVVQLEILLDFVHPRQLKKDLMGTLLQYLSLEKRTAS
jgi:hypothetical protein